MKLHLLSLGDKKQIAKKAIQLIRNENRDKKTKSKTALYQDRLNYLKKSKQSGSERNYAVYKWIKVWNEEQRKFIPKCKWEFNVEKAWEKITRERPNWMPMNGVRLDQLSNCLNDSPDEENFQKMSKKYKNDMALDFEGFIYFMMTEEFRQQDENVQFCVK